MCTNLIADRYVRMEFGDSFWYWWHNTIKLLHVCSDRGHEYCVPVYSSKLEKALFPELYFAHVDLDTAELIMSENFVFCTSGWAVPRAADAFAKDWSQKRFAPSYLFSLSSTNEPYLILT
jgi:hypothetical protein